MKSYKVANYTYEKKSYHFFFAFSGTPVTQSAHSVSGSDRSIAKSQTQESPAQFSPYGEVTFRNKSSPFTRLKRDYNNRTANESPGSDKTKPKLKINSFEMGGDVASSNATFQGHSEPPPSYEESEMLKLKERERRKAMIIESQSEREDNDKDTEKNFETELWKSKEENKNPMLSQIRSSSPVNSERSYTTNGSRKRAKLKPPPKLAILNWADILPGPP